MGFAIGKAELFQLAEQKNREMSILREFIEAIRHNFIPLFKSVTRQTGGKVSRSEFDEWMEEVNNQVLKHNKSRKKDY